MSLVQISPTGERLAQALRDSRKLDRDWYIVIGRDDDGMPFAAETQAKAATLEQVVREIAGASEVPVAVVKLNIVEGGIRFVTEDIAWHVYWDVLQTGDGISKSAVDFCEREGIDLFDLIEEDGGLYYLPRRAA